MKNLIITTGHERHKILVNYLMQNSANYTIIQSVVPKKNDKYYNCNVVHKGNSGLCIGHLRALELASKSDEPCNIFEDDEILKEDYIQNRDELLSELTEWHYVNLNTLRPTGMDDTHHFGKIASNLPRYSSNWRVNNIWLSNYCVKPEFAATILHNLQFQTTQWHGRSSNLCRCFNKEVYDQYFALHVADISNHYNCYVTKTPNLISIHTEAISIRKQNN